MGTLMKNRQVVGGTPVVDTALDTQSTDVVQNKVVAEQFSAINSTLPQKEWGELTNVSPHVYTTYGYFGYCIHNGFLIFSCADFGVRFQTADSNEITIGRCEIPSGYKIMRGGFRTAWSNNASTQGGSIWVGEDDTIRIYSGVKTNVMVAGASLVIPLIKA